MPNAVHSTSTGCQGQGAGLGPVVLGLPLGTLRFCST